MNKRLFLSALGIVGGALVAPVLPHAAMAATTTVTDAVKNVGSNAAIIPSLLNYGSYILGVSLGISGIQKLRQHTESAQVSASEGLSRLAAAAVFISLPVVLGMLQSTSNVDGGTTGAYHGITALGNT